jgi:uncharacterized repeat protein (TIGR01451 family)
MKIHLNLVQIIAGAIVIVSAAWLIFALGRAPVTVTTNQSSASEGDVCQDINTVYPPGSSQPAVITGQCVGSSNVLIWPGVDDYSARSQDLQRSIDNGPWKTLWSTRFNTCGHCGWCHSGGYVDLDPAQGHTYQYRLATDAAAGVYSNVITCPAPPTPTPTPVPGAICPDESMAFCGLQYEQMTRMGMAEPLCGISSGHGDGAYGLRFGGGNYDPASGKYWNLPGNAGPGTGVDFKYFTTWAWGDWPRLDQPATWCGTADQQAQAVPTTPPDGSLTGPNPPKERPSTDAWQIRCFYSYYLYTQGKATWNDVVGGLNYDAYPLCHRCRTAEECKDPANVLPAVYKWRPSPAFAKLTCGPANQIVAIDQNAIASASGGDGSYTWSITQGGHQVEGGADQITVSYATSGTKVLRVNSAGKSAACTIVVTGAQPTTQPSAQPSVQPGQGPALLSVAKYASKTTIPSGQTAIFTVRITNVGGTPTSNLAVVDVVPDGMSYLAGSTQVQGQTVAFDTIATSGLALGVLNPADTVTIQWSAIADQAGQITGDTPERSHPTVTVIADNTQSVTAAIDVSVYGPNAGGVAGVPTGPGDAVTIALLVAAALTLLYTGYTRSLTYRRHEARVISRDQGPLDFRS